jgi:alkanesulfonate monooxygenase SsuD/methylene tetrahydromethanopterin reductase-like flavin-dependent oxidoreductase (luciferase family)
VTLPDPAGRQAGLAETVEALRRLWTERRTSFDGKQVHLDRAFSFPKPLNPRPGLHVFDEHPDDPALSTAAVVDPRSIDGLIWHAEPAQVRTGIERLHACGESVGDDPGRIERTVLLECQIFDSVRDRDRWLATPYILIFWSEHPDLYMRRNLAGTVEGVRARLREYVAAGVTRFLVWFRDFPSPNSMRRFMAEVAPAVSVPVVAPPVENHTGAGTAAVTG